MIGFKEAIDYIKLGKKTQVSIFVACMFMIIIAQSDSLLDMLSIKELVKSLLPIISLIAIGLLGFIIGAPIYEIGNSSYRGYFTRRSIEGYLKQLTNDEKELLKPYVEQNKRTMYFDLQDGAVSGLCSKNILFRSANVGLPASTSFAYNIQDVAYNIIKAKPAYLLIDENKIEVN